MGVELFLFVNIAQLGERQTEDLKVLGSNPGVDMRFCGIMVIIPVCGTGDPSSILGKSIKAPGSHFVARVS